MALQIRTLSERVHEILRERIATCIIPPGAPIRQDILAAELGISKIPIREALSRLEEAGLVRSAANRGYVAAPLSLEEADEVFALRLLIEPPTAALAAQRADANAKRVVAALTRRLATEGGDLKVTATSRLQLLLAILDPARRPTTNMLVAGLYYRAERYIQTARVQGDLQVADLRTLSSAWEEGRPSEVEALYKTRLETRWAAARDNLTTR